MRSSDYSVDELMVCLMSREMRDGEVVVQGFSTPLVFTAFVLAKRTHAPASLFHVHNRKQLSRSSRAGRHFVH